MNSFTHVIASVAGMPRKAYPTKSIVNIVMICHLLQKLSLLLTDADYGGTLYQDNNIALLKSIVGPFGLTALLFNARNDDLTLCAVSIALIIVYIYVLLLLFMAMAYKFELYNPGNPRGGYKIVTNILYNGLMYVESLIYIPFAKLMIEAVICDENSILIQYRDSATCPPIYIIIIVVIGILCLMGVVTLSNFYFRTYELQPDNNFKKKFTVHSIIIPYLNLLLILASVLSTSTLTIVVRCIFANIQGLMWIIEIYYYCPFSNAINKLVFTLAIFYEQFVFLLTIQVASPFMQSDKLFDWLVIVGTFLIYLSIIVYDNRTWHYLKQESHGSPYKLLSLVQILQDHTDSLMKNHKDHVQWYYAITNHLISCKSQICSHIWCRIQQHGVENHKSITRTVISCLLRTSIGRQQQRRVNPEFIQLVLIQFQIKQCQQFLPGYLSFKNLQLKTQVHSFYFNSIWKSLDQLLKDNIIRKQYQLISNGRNDHLNKQLTMLDIYQSIKFEELYLPKIVEMIDQKSKYWEKIINGYQHINDFAEFTINLSTSIITLNKQMETDFNCNLAYRVNTKQFTTVTQLKLLSLYFSVAINDIQNVSIYINQCIHCEQELEDILHQERSLNDNRMTNAALIDQKVILISISTIANRGTIINKERAQYASFFNYDKQSFNNVTHINQLMPPFIRKRHDQILDRYLQIGQSDRFSTPRIVFTLSLDGFLNAAHIRLNNFFESQDDYILSASFSKVKENADYLLFDAKGKIIGITNGLFTKLHDLACPSGTTTQQFSLETLLSMGYAFILFPDITEIIKTQREELIWSESEEVTFDLKTTLCIPKSINQDFFDYKNHKTQSRVSFNQFKTVRSDKELIRVQSEATNEFADNEGTFDVNFNDKTHLLGCHIPLLEHTYQESIYEFNNNQLQTREFKKYQVTVQLGYSIIGDGKNSYPYFFLEITEIKQQNHMNRTINQSNDLLDLTISAESSFSKPQAFSTCNFQRKSIEFNANLQTNRNIQLQLRIPFGNDQNNEEITDTNRQIPFSKRALFDNPVSLERRQSDGSQPEKQIRDLLNIGNESLSLQNIHKLPDESQLKFSSQRENQSHNIRELLMKNINEVNHQSQGSQITTLSNTKDTIQMIRSIKYNTKLNSQLRIILAILFTQLAIQLMMIGIHVRISADNTASDTLDLDDNAKPYDIAILYQKVLVYGWVHFYTSQELVTYSPFINQSLIRYTNYLLNNIQLLEIEDSYRIFVKVEAEGLIPTFDINFVVQPKEYDQAFSKFYFLQKQTFNRILINILTDGIDQSLIFDLLFLQGNVEVEFELIDKLLASLDIQFQQLLASRQTLNLNLFMIFLLVLGMLNFITLIFWFKIINFQQKILINTSRVSQHQALEMITRLQLIKEVIKKQAKHDWRQVDYYQLVFNKLQDVNIHTLRQGTHELHKTVNSEINKNSVKQKNSNQILTSRIEKNTFSYTKEVILLFGLFMLLFSMMFGGYLLQTYLRQLQQEIQNLTISFINYSIGFNENIYYAFYAKIYYIVMPNIIENNLIEMNQDMYNKLSDTSSGIKFLETHYFSNSYVIQNFYEKIYDNNELNDENRQILLDLYSKDFCLQIAERMEFCDYPLFTEDQFISTYGMYSQEDNNLQYVSEGILGQYGRVHKIMTENYEIEINSGIYDKDVNKSMEFIQTGIFINAILQNYLNYQFGYDLFIDTLIEQTGVQLLEADESIRRYYFIAGIGITFLIGILKISYVIYRNHRLHMIRLGIVNTPMEILQDGQTILFLRLVERN